MNFYRSAARERLNFEWVTVWKVEHSIFKIWIRWFISKSMILNFNHLNWTHRNKDWRLVRGNIMCLNDPAHVISLSSQAKRYVLIIIKLLIALACLKQIKTSFKNCVRKLSDFYRTNWPFCAVREMTTDVNYRVKQCSRDLNKP